MISGFPVSKGEAWALVPARGGSKSIPKKNVVSLGGRPLIEYVLAAARSCKEVSRTICSTDHQEIASVCERSGAEVHWRPSELAGDEAAVIDVLTHLLLDMAGREGKIPEIICLLQPTSPFVLPQDIDEAVRILRDDGAADSVQTITTMPHNHHAYNQRVIENGSVGFRFLEERRIHYNKQTKPSHYIFGNLVVTKTATIIEQNDVWGGISRPIQVSPFYAMDVDGPGDVELAEWMLATGKIDLPHIDGGLNG